MLLASSFLKIKTSFQKIKLKASLVWDFCLMKPRWYHSPSGVCWEVWESFPSCGARLRGRHHWTLLHSEKNLPGPGTVVHQESTCAVEKTCKHATVELFPTEWSLNDHLKLRDKMVLRVVYETHSFKIIPAENNQMLWYNETFLVRSWTPPSFHIFVNIYRADLYSFYSSTQCI